jgi:hypothetical protein
MHPDAEHQEDDPELGQLPNRLDVPLESWSERAESDSGEEVAHDRRQAEPPRHQTPDEGVGERQSDVHEKGYVVHERLGCWESTKNLPPLADPVELFSLAGS